METDALKGGKKLMHLSCACEDEEDKNAVVAPHATERERERVVTVVAETGGL